MLKTLLALWSRLSPKQQAWLKGAEKAAFTGLGSAIFAEPFADFHSKEGIAKYVAAISSAVVVSLRLYMAQSPIQNVIFEQKLSSTTKEDGVTKTDAISTTVTGNTDTLSPPKA